MYSDIVLPLFSVMLPEEDVYPENVHVIRIVSLIFNLLCVLVSKTGRQTAGRTVLVDRLTNQLTSKQ